MMGELKTIKACASENRLLSQSEYHIGGYPIDDILADIDRQVTVLAVRDKRESLKSKKNTLSGLVSEEKRKSDTLDDIENALKTM